MAALAPALLLLAMLNMQIGPLTGVTGYNGLGLSTTDETDIEAAALKGYQLSVMQQLMPISEVQGTGPLSHPVLANCGIDVPSERNSGSLHDLQSRQFTRRQSRQNRRRDRA